MKDRTFVRGQGCWNCVHAQSAIAFWTDKRQKVLEVGVRIATDSLLGEQHQQVINIRRMVDVTDHAVARNELIRCTKGKLANGQPVGDLTAHNFLCHKWTGRPGASLARVDGKLDKLPEELRDDLDGPEPFSITRLSRKLAKETA